VQDGGADKGKSEGKKNAPKERKPPFQRQVATAKLAKEAFFEPPFAAVADPLALIDRSWVRGRVEREVKKDMKPSQISEPTEEENEAQERRDARRKERAVELARGRFGWFPLISALLLFPLAWYFGSIRAVVDAGTSAICG
jgi:hypothetical protein